MTSRGSNLFSEFKIRGLHLKNRIVVSPMQMYVAEAGIAADWHFQHLARFAIGGAALVMTEALAIEPLGRSTHRDLGIWNDEQVPGLRRIVDFLHQQRTAAGAQLHHAGGKAARRLPWQGSGPLSFEDPACPAWQPVSSTKAATSAGWHVPIALEQHEIAALVVQFGDAARRCVAAGFDLLEIHAAHGYLIHSFLSPINNDRTDGYGGDFEGRTRFLREVVQCVRANWLHDRPLSVRLSCVDDAPGGWSIEDSVELARLLKGLGVDVIDCTSGGIRGRNTLANLALRKAPVRKGYQVPYAARIRAEADIPTIAVGLIVDASQADDILKQGSADLVAIGREALRNPNWPLEAALALEQDRAWDRWPASYGFWLRERAATGFSD